MVKEVKKTIQKEDPDPQTEGMTPDLKMILNHGEKIKRKEITEMILQRVDIEETEAVRDTTTETIETALDITTEMGEVAPDTTEKREAAPDTTEVETHLKEELGITEKKTVNPAADKVETVTEETIETTEGLPAKEEESPENLALQKR